MAIETRGAKPEILVAIDNDLKTLKQLSQEYNLSYITLNKRYYAGLRGYELVKPIPQKLIDSRKFKEYEKQLLINRSK